jgi:hypothetical protein
LETRDREPAAGREETIEGGVVVRFPGDWVGPLDELVPFGPSADRDQAATAGEPDFWGEGSAALQDAVEAPAVPGGVAQARPVLPRIGPKLLAAVAVVAALLLGVAAILGADSFNVPRARPVTFAIASIPPLAPPAKASVKRIARRRHVADRVATKPRSTVQAASPGTSPSPKPPASTPAPTPPASTPASTYHPASASSASAGSGSTQTGGAFTLGGP